MFRELFLAATLLGVALLGTVAAQQGTEKPANHVAQFEKLKQLVGTWVEADADGKPTERVASVVRLTAGGSAVHETLFPGDEMEMVSVYHLDQGELLMTHYCMLGNQPRMKADPASPKNKIRWQFAGGTNLDPQKDMHMHSSVVTFIDQDHIEIEGEAWENGKPSPDHCGKLKLVRKPSK